jgi:hypothetical protein
MRRVSLMFSIWIFVLIYKLASVLYNRKVALYSIGVYSIYYYWFLSNNIIDLDAAIGSFFMLFSFFISLKYWFKKIYNIFLISLLLSFETISRPILWLASWFIILLVYILSVNKLSIWSFFKNIKEKYFWMFIWILLYLIISGVLLLIIFQLDPEIVKVSFNWLLARTLNYHNFMSPLLFVLQLLLYLSPIVLLIFLSLKSFKKHYVLLLPIIFFFLYVIAVRQWDMPRYFMHTIPYIVIIVGYNISNFNIWKIRNYIYIWLFTSLIVLCNYIFIDYSKIPLGMNDFLADPFNKILILSTSVSRAIYIQPILLYTIFSISTLLFIFYVFLKKKLFIRFFIFLLAWWNIFLIISHTFEVGQPKLDNAYNGMLNYCYNNCKSSDKIYVDFATNAWPIATVIYRDIWENFSIQPNEKLKYRLTSIINNYHLRLNENVFTPVPVKQSWIYEYIKEHWSWYIFFLNYISTKYNKSLPIMDRYCKKKYEYKTLWNITSVIYYCSL